MTSVLRSRLLSIWPFALALGLLLALLGAQLSASLQAAGGRLVYTLDDAYIHMAMAKNLALHGVWGVTRFAFTSSSSSLLWTLLLAAVYAVSGVNEIAPLILNLVFACAALALAAAVLRRAGLPGWASALVLAVMVLGTPMPTLILCGMEHTLHLLLALAFLYAAIRALREDANSSRWNAPLFALAPLLVMARYEGAFLVAAACLLLFLQRRFRFALLLGFTGLLPVLAYGAMSVSQGWYFFPNSVLLKSNFPKPENPPLESLRLLVWLPIRSLIIAPHLFGLLAAATLLVRRLWPTGAVASEAFLGTALFLIAATMHLLFAGVGWFFRYEAYLVAIGLVAIAAALPAAWPPQAAGPLSATAKRFFLGATVWAGFLLYCLAVRAAEAIRVTPTASANIFQQHYQMGLFIQKYYSGEAVVANDIGAICFLADIRLADLSGLATMEVGVARREGTMTTALIDQAARRVGARIAIVYEDWYADFGGLPADWRKAADWTIHHNVVTGGETIAFFAIGGEDAEVLREWLREFTPQLPLGVDAHILAP